MKRLAQIQENFIAKRNEIKKLKERENQREKQIIRLKTKRYKLEGKYWWGDTLVRPIMELVKEKFPNVVWDDKDLVPMGLSSRISIFGKTKEDKLIGLAFIPYDLKEGVLHYETGEQNNRYMRGSIGELNGFNYEKKELKSIEEIYLYIEQQLAK